MIYLDNAASTPCLDCAMDAMQDVNQHWSNVHRGLHRYADIVTTKYEEARERVANFIGADTDEIVFTSGATDSLNMVANGLELNSGDCVVVTQMDHHSNILPWMAQGCKVEMVKVVDGKLDLNHLNTLLKKHPKVVAFPAVSNVLGVVNPVDIIAEMAHEKGAMVVVDAAQSAPNIPTDVRHSDIDFLAFSGHKLHGPTGVGVLYVRKDNFERLKPSRYGGGMALDVRDTFAIRTGYHGLEAGTPPIQQAIGLGAACQFWEKRGMHHVDYQILNRTSKAYTKLESLPYVEVLGPSVRERTGIISFTFDGIHAHDVAALLNEKDIAVRAGHHCAQPLHDALGIKASVRVSFSYFNKMEDIDALIDSLKEIKEGFN